ncbi:MAG TPA: error-prone DNA polymerase [Burkholderiales bacterium]|jgi:error-prone DNA polymerase
MSTAGTIETLIGQARATQALPPEAASPSSPGERPLYCELHCITNFSFLRGASHAEELIKQAMAQGYGGLAITDECSLAGVVRAHGAIDGAVFQLIVGSEFRFTDDAKRFPGLPHSRIVLLAQTLEGYERLSTLITRARLKAGKGSYKFSRHYLRGDLTGCLCLYMPDLPIRASTDANAEEDRIAILSADAAHIARRFPGRMWIAAELHAGPNDAANRHVIKEIARRTTLPIVAAGDVCMHVRERKSLADVMTAIRLNVPVQQCGHALLPSSARHLRSIPTLQGTYDSQWLEESLKIARQCEFSLDELKYEYPEEMVPTGETKTTHLRKLTEAGLKVRYPDGPSSRIRKQVETELALIEKKEYEAYFLTVHDIVRFARGEGILCQGRGSAANSAVCYALGVTAVDPEIGKLMFARFLSENRSEPPDIDVDFEHERRELVIQHLYEKYGRHRAALAAAVSVYQTRGALRDAGRALGFSNDQLDAVSKNLAWWDGGNTLDQRLTECGLSSDSTLVAHLLLHAEQLRKMPRHLSQHSGGFVLSGKKLLSGMVPVENAAMKDRTVIQWDKNDLEAVGLMKVDVLGLGMLSLIRRAMEAISEQSGRRLAMEDIPKEDPEVYDMLCAGESMGVFQVESRAQMSMLPRLRPRRFYDLVIEVAIVRPGPIQGGMVHPYLKRRQGLEPVTYPSPEVRGVLERTLGVSIFQEQVMQLAMVAAGFTESEADQLRRAMAAWSRRGDLEPFEARLKQGLISRDYTEEYANQLFNQIRGFGEYGFPESHAHSFALLVYISSWLKRHEPAIFLLALLNSQPLGFYSPSQLVQDARHNGVEVLPVDVNQSNYEAKLEHGAEQAIAWRAAFERRMARGSYIRPEEDHPEGRKLGHYYEGSGELRADIYPFPHSYRRTPQAAVRLGLKKIANLSVAGADRLLEARRSGPFADMHDLTRRAKLDRSDLEALAAADALAPISGHRRRAMWDVIGVEAPIPLTPEIATPEGGADLLPPDAQDELRQDYSALRLSLRPHPLTHLRPKLRERRLMSAAELSRYPHGRLARACGIVTGRQRPGTAKGTIFVTLEDETGYVNVVCWPRLIEQFRRAILLSRLMTVYGVWETDGKVAHLIAKHVVDDSAMIDWLETPPSRDFR